MKKGTKKEKEAPVNVDQVKSMMGEKNFNQAVTQERYAGASIEEAPELVARKKLKGMI